MARLQIILKPVQKNFETFAEKCTTLFILKFCVKLKLYTIHVAQYTLGTPIHQLIRSVIQIANHVEERSA